MALSSFGGAASFGAAALALVLLAIAGTTGAVGTTWQPALRPTVVADGVVQERTPMQPRRQGERALPAPWRGGAEGDQAVVLLEEGLELALGTEAMTKLDVDGDSNILGDSMNSAAGQPTAGIPALSSLMPSSQSVGASSRSSSMGISAASNNDFSEKSVGSSKGPSTSSEDRESSSRSSSSGESGQQSSKTPSASSYPIGKMFTPFSSLSNAGSDMVAAAGGAGFTEVTYNPSWHLGLQSTKAVDESMEKKSGPSGIDSLSASSPPSAGRDSVSSGTSSRLSSSSGDKEGNHFVLSPANSQSPATSRFAADNLFWDTVVTRALHLTHRSFFSAFALGAVLSLVYKQLKAAHGELTMFDKATLLIILFYWCNAFVWTIFDTSKDSGRHMSKPFQPLAESGFSVVRVASVDTSRSLTGASMSNADAFRNSELKAATDRYSPIKSEDIGPSMPMLFRSMDTSANSRESLSGISGGGAGAGGGASSDSLIGYSASIPGAASIVTQLTPVSAFSDMSSQSKSLEPVSNAESMKDVSLRSPFSSVPSESDADKSPSDLGSSITSFTKSSNDDGGGGGSSGSSSDSSGGGKGKGDDEKPPEDE